MYGHLRTPSAEYTHTREVVHSLQGGTDWPTYSGSSTAVSHALNWSGLSIIILGGFRVTVWHRRPRGHTLVTRGATSEREVSTLLDEDSRHSEISRCCIDMESRVSRRRAIWANVIGTAAAAAASKLRSEVSFTPTNRSERAIKIHFHDTS